MKQTLIRFELPDGCTLYASDFREKVAKAGHGLPYLPPSFFHYGEDGLALSSGSPDIRFVGGKRWVGILSQSGNAQALLPVTGVAAQVVGEVAGQPVPLEVVYPNYGIELTDYPIRYYVRDLVAKHQNRWRGSNEELLARMVLAAIRGERDRLGLDLPGVRPEEIDFSQPVMRGSRPMQYPERVEHADLEVLRERLSFAVHEARSMGLRFRASTGLTNASFGLLNGTFSMCAKLGGYWQAGNLQSRGHGRLIRAIGGLA